MLAFQILIDGFAISALYALGATGFTLIFGVSGVLNLSHGAIMVLAAVAAWAAASVLHLDTYSGALGGAGFRADHLFCGGAADPAIPTHS
jgi:branched-chain amino acid transport system permease protein